MFDFKILTTESPGRVFKNGRDPTYLTMNLGEVAAPGVVVSRVRKQEYAKALMYWTQRVAMSYKAQGKGKGTGPSPARRPRPILPSFPVQYLLERACLLCVFACLGQTRQG